MNRYKRDGTPITSNQQHANATVGGQLSKSEMNRLKDMLRSAIGVHIATVREIFYTDNPKNLSKEYVEYTIRLESGKREGQEYENVVALNLGGGRVNFSETVYHPRTKNLDDSELTENSVKTVHDAAEVLVVFLDNRNDQPFIIGGVPSSKQFIDGAKEEDGQRSLMEYNGIRTLINKDGEYYLMYLGGERETSKTKETAGKTARPKTAPTIFKILKDGTLAMIDKESQSVKIDTTNKKITISQQEELQPDETPGQIIPTEKTSKIVNSVEMDKAGKKITTLVGTDTVTDVKDGTEEKVTRTYKSGLTVTEDGKNDKVEVSTSGGVTTVIDGKSTKITLDASGTVIEIDGSGTKVTITAGSSIVEIDGASGKIALKGSLVDIGTAAASFAALGPELLAWLTTHVHGPGPSIFPTSPPVVPPTQDLISATVKVQK